MFPSANLMGDRIWVVRGVTQTFASKTEAVETAEKMLRDGQASSLRVLSVKGMR